MKPLMAIVDNGICDHSMAATNEKANYAQGILVFNITETQSFALGTLKIREIIPYKPMNAFPGAHPTVKGAIEMRGQTIPVLDLAAAVGYDHLTNEQLKTCVIIVTDCQRKTIGFLVRSIERIIECNWREIKSPPKALGHNAFITGICNIGEELIQMLDLEYVMSNVFPEDNSEQHAVLTDIQREQLKPLNILLVDDSMVARKQLTDALSYMNIPFLVTENGHDALLIMESEADKGTPIDLLVSDIEMPGLDGYELAFSVRDKPALSAAYIVLHTSLSSHISVSQATQVGANEALTKFNVQELIASMLRGAEFKISAIG
jgi:two-component system chemotaxis response regulator CheV